MTKTNYSLRTILLLVLLLSASIASSEDYFYLRFRNGTRARSYVCDQGVGQQLRIANRNSAGSSADDDRLWTWEDGRLRNRAGHYIARMANDDFTTTDDVAAAETFTPWYDESAFLYLVRGSDGMTMAKSNDNANAVIVKRAKGEANARIELVYYEPDDRHTFVLRFTGSGTLDNNYIYAAKDGNNLTTTNGDVEISRMQWRMEQADDGGFRLRNERGHYMAWKASTSRYVATADASAATSFSLTRSATGDLSLVRSDDGKAMTRVNTNGNANSAVGEGAAGAQSYVEFVESVAEQNWPEFSSGQRYYLLFQDNNENGLKGMLDLKYIYGDEDLELKVNVDGLAMSWMLDGTHDAFRMQRSDGRCIAWMTDRYKATSDATKAATFSFVRQQNGWTIRRTGSDYMTFATNDNSRDNFFKDIEAVVRSRIYLRATDDDFNALSRATEQNTVIHRQSVFADRADQIGDEFPDEFLKPGQGWTTAADGTTPVQNTSEYRMTRYVKRGEYIPLYLTLTNATGDIKHRRYQRWYFYDTEKPLTLDYYYPQTCASVYSNGLVMGNSIKQPTATSRSNVTGQLALIARLPERSVYADDTLRIAGDISRYSDVTYDVPNATYLADAGNLVEPTLTLRQIFTVIDANVMAQRLKTKTGDNWLEDYTVHFPAKALGTVAYEVLPLELGLENYWMYRDGIEDDDHLVNIVSDDYVTWEVDDPDGTGITILGFEDAPDNNRTIFVSNTQKKRRRLLKFQYPAGYSVAAGRQVVLKVYGRDSKTSSARYNIARFTIIFDGGSETLYWKDVVGDAAPRSERSPQSLRQLCDDHDPVAHIDFDYPSQYYFQMPPNGGEYTVGAGNDAKLSCALPLQYQMTNYTFGQVMPSWASYGVCTEGYYTWCNPVQTMRPVSAYTGVKYSDHYDAGVMYVDASDFPGTVADIKFNGSFCVGSRLMCSGWIASVSGTNAGQGPAPSSIILSVVGKKGGREETLYTFCPGQVDNRTIRYGSTAIVNYKDEGNLAMWHQFYFTFVVTEIYEEYELHIENNSRATSGADYLLDDVWVFAKLPKVRMAMSSPLCGGELAVMKLETDFESLLSAQGKQEATGDDPGQEDYLCCVYLDRTQFYAGFREMLATDHGLTFDDFDTFLARVNAGAFDDEQYFESYQKAFDAALMKVDVVDAQGQVTGQRVPYGNFRWTTNFSQMVPYTFARMAKDEDLTVFADTEAGVRKLIFNGTMGIDTWEDYKSYTLLTIQPGRALSDADVPQFARLFNLLDECSNQSYFKLLPKIEVVGHVGQQTLDEITFCENSVQTFAIELAGYTFNDEGDEATYVLDNVNFDWWIGDSQTSATVSEYRRVTSDDGSVSLDVALKRFRLMNPFATDLFTDIRLGAPELYPDQEFTEPMLALLRQLAAPADGSYPTLFLNSKLIDVNLSQKYMKIVEEPNIEGTTDRYVYVTAIPIETQINKETEDYVFICSDPQPVKLKVDGVAPVVQTGFNEKRYPDDIGMLSVRISKSQFEKVRQRGTGVPPCLHIPLRGVRLAHTEEAVGVTLPAEASARVVLLTGTTDPLMEQFIIAGYQNLLPPVVGRLTYLQATPEADPDGESGNAGDVTECVKLYFDEDFRVREGYSYTIRFPFVELISSGYDDIESCEGSTGVELKIVPDYEVWTGQADNVDWSNDDNWRRADFDELFAGNGQRLTADPEADNYYMTNDVNYVSDDDRLRRRGFAPLYCTNVLLMNGETAPAPVLYDDGDEYADDGRPTGFPALRPTASPIIRYDFQTYEWTDSHDAEATDKERNVRQVGDMITELYHTNTCDGMVLQSEAELLHSELLNYGKAWVEYALGKNRWHLVASPLKDMISAEWYAPTWSARQETTYFEPVTFDEPPVTTVTTAVAQPYTLGYDRFAPAVYQRAWDKAKAVVYEHGATWSADDGDQTKDNTGDGSQGGWTWQGDDNFQTWDSHNADDYLERIAYRPMGPSKANVAIRGTWSGVYNDHSVPYSAGGFCVMPINSLKTHDDEAQPAVFRLPKEDGYYDIWDWSKGYAVENRVRIFIGDGETATTPVDRTLTLPDRGRLRTDDLTAEAPQLSVTLKNEGKGSVGYFLAANPFVCGLDMEAFFSANPQLAPFYLVLENSDIAIGDSLTVGRDWRWTDVVVNGSAEDAAAFAGRRVVPARRAFFVKVRDPEASQDSVTVVFNTAMMTVGRDEAYPQPLPRGAHPQPLPNGRGASMVLPSRSGGGGLLLRAERHGNVSEARVVISPDAQDCFDPDEDVEAFTVEGITDDVPVVYTLCGRLATSINRLSHFTILPLGITSSSNEPCTVTFNKTPLPWGGAGGGLYDALEQTLTPITDGMQLTMPGRTEGRYFIVSGIGTDQPSTAPSVSITPLQGAVGVEAEGQEISQVSIYNPLGLTVASVQPRRRACTVPLPSGTYIVLAATADAQAVRKIVIR